jgi:spore coat polysaccharide biosynthesis predicted glycosyltransferase SpsG
MTPSRRATILTAGGRGIGLGHLRRTLALAAALREQGVAATFHIEGDAAARAIVEQDGHAARLVESLTPAAEEGLAKSDFVVADAYTLTEADFRALQSFGPLVVIDDLADRRITADVVINAGAGATPDAYAGMSVKVVLAGVTYAMLGPAFWSAVPRRVEGEVTRIVVTLGGSAAADDVFALAASARAACPNAVVVAITSGAAGDPPRRNDGIQERRDPPDFLSLIAAADVAITAAGQTMYELAALGTPAIAVCVADNQRPGVEAMAAANAVRYAGALSSPGITDAVAESLQQLAPAATRQGFAARSQNLVDGRGAGRAARAVLESLPCR